MDKFNLYYEFLISENKKYNLTAITKKEEVFIKHFEDSLALDKIIDFNKITTLVDVGSGAGFPSIPLKIKYPHLKLTIIEPNKKKTGFLEKLLLVLDLNNVIIISERAEEQKQLRETFDLATARAVASLSILNEICLPLIKKDAYFIAMKGPDYQEELSKANNSLKELKSRIEDIFEYELTDKMGRRTLIKILKQDNTPSKYPRSFALIKKKPL